MDHPEVDRSDNDAGQIRVLLADDVEGFRRIVRLFLERDGRFEVVGEADDGDVAIRMCAEEQPDVVVLDLGMPTHGADALPRIREAAPGARVVVLTGLQASDYGGASGLGADAVIQKGSPSDVIVRAVRAVALRDHDLGPS